MKGSRGEAGSETANHKEKKAEKKTKTRGSGFSIKAYTVELPPQLSLLSSPLPALCVVCVCVCASAQSVSFSVLVG